MQGSLEGQYCDKSPDEELELELLEELELLDELEELELEELELLDELEEELLEELDGVGVLPPPQATNNKVQAKVMQPVRTVFLVNIVFVLWVFAFVFFSKDLRRTNNCA